MPQPFDASQPGLTTDTQAHAQNSRGGRDAIHSANCCTPTHKGKFILCHCRMANLSRREANSESPFIEVYQPFCGNLTTLEPFDPV